MTVTSHPALKEALGLHVLAAANDRMRRDALVATWRDIIHEAMMTIPIDIKLLHEVMNNMDEYLRRSKN